MGWDLPQPMGPAQLYPPFVSLLTNQSDSIMINQDVKFWTIRTVLCGLIKLQIWIPHLHKNGPSRHHHGKCFIFKEGTQNEMYLTIKDCVFILKCLNFSHLQSTLHLMQYTYWDIFQLLKTVLGSSGQDGGVHRYTLPPYTVKRRTKINLKTTK